MIVLAINEATVYSYSMDDALAFLAKEKIKIDPTITITITSSDVMPKSSLTKFYLDGVEYFTDSPQKVATLVEEIVVKPAY